MGKLADRSKTTAASPPPSGRGFEALLADDRVLGVATALLPYLYTVARWLVVGRQTAIGIVDQAVSDVRSQTPRNSSPTAADLRLALLSKLAAAASAVADSQTSTDGTADIILSPDPGLSRENSSSAAVLEHLEHVSGDRLRIALHRILPAVRLPVVLRYLADLTVSEIAHVLELPSSVVAERLGAGRDLLVAQLASRGPGPEEQDCSPR